MKLNELKVLGADNKNFDSISESYHDLVTKMFVKIDSIKHNLFMLESGIF